VAPSDDNLGTQRLALSERSLDGEPLRQIARIPHEQVCWQLEAGEGRPLEGFLAAGERAAWRAGRG